MICPICKKETKEYNGVIKCPIWDTDLIDHAYEYSEDLLESFTVGEYVFLRNLKILPCTPIAYLEKEIDMGFKDPIREWWDVNPSNEEVLALIKQLVENSNN